MRRRHTLLSLLVLLSLLLAACGGGAASPTAPAAQAPAEEPAEQPAEQATEAPAEQPVEEPAEQPTEAAEEPAEQPAGDGEAVSVLSLWGGSEQEAFQQVLDHCQESVGVTTQYEQARDFVPVLTSRVAGGNPPDVAIVPRPGVMVDLAEQGAIVPLADLGLGDDVMQENYGQAWIDLGTVEGALYGIVVKANSKSTIWYKPSSFEEQGFEIPETYDALVELSQAYVDAGQTPWAIGGKDTWTLTDWFENIYVRTAGPEMYSQLFGGELPFTDESVVTAMQEMARIVGNPEFIAGGVEGALGTGFVDGIGRVFGENPDAELYFEGGFVGGIALGEVNPDLQPGQDIAFFPFPQFNDEIGSPLIGGGDLAVAFANRPEVGQLMQCLASQEAGEVWAATGAIVSPNQNVDPGVYPNELATAEAAQVAAAEAFRFDGSDLLPGPLAETWGQTLQGVVENPDDIESLLADFEDQAAAEFGR